MADTRNLALYGLDTSSGRGLEIGPLNSPLLPRSPGRIFSADHCSTDELKAKYDRDPNVLIDDICDVDFDLSRMALSETGKDGSFDYVVASHVVEHVPDLVGWLRSIQAILKDGGVLALVVPDKRFTFDIFRRESAFWMVQDAVGLSRPSIEMVIDHFINNVEADAHKLWANSEYRHELRRAISPEVCPDLIERHHRGEYIDAHCWVFTPSSFVKLLGQIIEQYELDYELVYFKTTLLGQLEFYVQLRKSQGVLNWEEQAKKAEREEASNQQSSVPGFLRLVQAFISLGCERLSKKSSTFLAKIRTSRFGS